MTLIELVVVITLSAIVVSFMTGFIVQPIEAFAAEKQRAQLSDAADSALRLMARDLRAALPNSIRTTQSGTVYAIEMLATVDGARYQDNPVTGAWLDFTQADTQFSTTVPFSQVAQDNALPTKYLAIYNIGIIGANAYAIGPPTGVITPPGTTITIVAGTPQLVNLSPAFQFTYPSPGKRVYLVSGPVSYLCDTSTGLLTRYFGYTILATQPIAAASMTGTGLTVGVVASNVAPVATACTFTYAAGTSARGGMASLQLQLSNNGQEVKLLEQTHLVNGP